MEKKTFRRSDWSFLGLLLASGTLVLWLAPAERTLGEGIKLVMVHVALTWAGLVGLVLAGVLGLIVAAVGSVRALAWGRAVGWVAAGLYALGLVISILAAWANWGGVFWQEPRMLAALNGLAVVLVAQLGSGWLPWRRSAGVLLAIPPAFLAWSTTRAALVLHPGNPILTSTSPAIQVAFLGMFAVCLLGAGWLVMRLGRTTAMARGEPI